MGIYTDKRNSSFGLSFNIFWLLRFCIVNVMIACAQMIPGLQVVLILITNTLFFIYFLQSYHKYNIFEKGWSNRSGYLLEVTLQVFFVSTFIFYINDCFLILSSGTFQFL